ncbi:MAG: tyrosine--tRNA ligase [Proteobacteria bacterium]|nr:tyrosine--tRNA ligase [Pseudomonadota bacterium]
MPTTTLLQDLKARALISQTTPGLEEHLKQPRTLYCGFDPTADSLHIGSLVPLLVLRRFQQAGHTPIVLVGGATGMIGDPSFKAQERKLNDESTIKSWVEKLEKQTAPFFKGQTPAAKMANNYDWTHGVSVLQFLREVGKHFSVNNLIAKEAIKSRLEREDSGISFTEFTYPLLQAFDFQQLLKLHTCTVQVGGSDQWGNMTAGTELIRKTEGKEAHVLTLPLVTKADGTKFGKTESGTIWLSAEKTSPYAFYQFWLNTADADVEKFLGYFSFKSLDEISALVATHKQAPEKRAAQKALAEEITALVHGDKALQAAQRISEALFGGDLSALTESDYAQLAQDGLPTTRGASHPVLQALAECGLAQSNREARDFLKGNAVQVNGEVITDEKHELTKANAKFGKYHLIRRGKKNFALLVLE